MPLKVHKLPMARVHNRYYTLKKATLKALLPNKFGVSASVWAITTVFIHYTEFSEEPIKFHVYPIK